MTRALKSTTLFVLSACAMWAQSGTPPAFDVATIKPAAPMADGKMRIGFGGDEGRIDYTNVSLKDVVARAYRLKPYQVTGPAWIDSQRYDISAKIPAGAKDRVPEMLQSLLAERFNMTVHKESKEQPIYALVVGKNGAKLKKSSDGDASALVAPDGSRVAAPKGAMMADSTGRIQANGVTMANFSDMLSRMLDRPVVDMTGIEGNYDLTLEIAMEDLIGMKRMAGGAAMMHSGGGDGGPAPDSNPRASMFTAVQQLGLKLDPRKAPLDFLVIDKADKAATEN